jgi:hypothetical protein
VRWYADNPDTFQYLAIAGKYLSGDLSHAINGYWSPLISWLLIIPISIFSDDLLAFKILQCLIGLFVLFQWTSFIYKTTIKEGLKKVLAFFVIPFVLNYSLLNATPDLLFMGILLMIMNLYIGKDIFSRKKLSILTGIAGAFLFLTKSFGFPLYIAFILIITFIAVRKENVNKILIRNIFYLFFSFFLISSLWIIPLSIQYGKITISESAKFNLSKDVTPLPGRDAALPILNKGLNKPLGNSLSAWEHPGEYVSQETVSVFKSPAEYFQVVKRNLLSIYYFDFRNQAGIIFLFLLFLFIIKKRVSVERWIVVTLLIIGLVYFGYSLILYHTRYAWLNNLLMIILSVYFLQSIFEKFKYHFVLYACIYFILLLGLKRPLKEIMFTADKDYPLEWTWHSLKKPFTTLWIFYRPDLELNNIIKEVQRKKLLQGNVASIKNKNLERDSYTSSLRISLAAKSPYYGQLDETLSQKEQEEELVRNNIDFLITLKNPEWRLGTIVFSNLESGITIYRLK